MNALNIITGTVLAIGFATALVAGSAEQPAPVRAIEVGPVADELVAMCRAVYGPQATVYMRTQDQAACDPRGVEGGR